jgi:hypothetical protein
LFRTASHYEIKTMTLLMEVLQPLGFVEPLRYAGEVNPPAGILGTLTVGQGEGVACRVIFPPQDRALGQEPGAFGGVRGRHCFFYAAGW